MPPDIAAYPDQGASFIYNLLFADDAGPFRPVGEGRLAALFADPPDLAALTVLAADEALESRLRVLASRRLGEAGSEQPADLPVLGVIVEVGLDGGLDTLAAYADGRVRYINQAGGMSVVETPELVAAQVAALLDAARGLAPTLPARTSARGAPPPASQVRLTLLVGGGQHVTEGTFESLAADGPAGPVLAAALSLLGEVMAIQGLAGDAGAPAG